MTVLANRLHVTVLDCTGWENQESMNRVVPVTVCWESSYSEPRSMIPRKYPTQFTCRIRLNWDTNPWHAGRNVTQANSTLAKGILC